MEPDSLLSAAKKTAAAAGFPWPHVLKVYQALQLESGDGAWLPKSRGRKVHAAEPHHIARLIIALAGSSEGVEGARRAVELFLSTSENGEGSIRLEDVLSHALSNMTLAETVSSVEFLVDRVWASFVTKKGLQLFRQSPEAASTDEPIAPSIPAGKLIRFRGVIDGELFRLLCREITWVAEGESSEAKG